MANIIRAASRRDILKITALSSVGGLLGAAQARAAPKTLTLMHESSFIPAYDAYVKNTLAPAYEKATGIKLIYETVSVGSVQTRVTTIAETGTGADMSQLAFNWPFLFDQKLVDVTDIAKVIGDKAGGWHAAAAEAVIVHNKWKAIPFGNIGQLMNWRTDWFGEVGVKTFPETWDELLEAGIKLKKAGRPFGMELGHGFGDNHGWLYPLLWSFGAREVEPDGKTVAIDSAETAKAVDFCRRFFKETMFEDVLGWTDVSNNKAYLSEQISCTNNAESILYIAKRDFPEIAKATGQSLNPKGPTGKRFHILNPWTHGIFTHTPDHQAAKDFMVWLMDPKQVSGWYDVAVSYYAPFLHMFDDAPLWHKEPRNLPYRDSLASSHLPGWPAPISRPQSESVAKYVVVDMFAKACAGKSTKEVIADANAQLKQIFKAAA
ncbi:MAG TPA: ABC transporter substrate-binding protein [Acetobacteraceae bacterium]|nr:ABC transporter substrate-binding protein [Acetobacteraceae bacterium]